MASVYRILVVGAGLTSSLVAHFASRHGPNACRPVELVVWEKARGIGGRTAVLRHGALSVDTGMQYVTLRPDSSDTFRQLVKDLERRDVLRPVEGAIEGDDRFSPPGSVNFAAPQGTNTLAKTLFKDAGVSPVFQKQLKSLEFVPRQTATNPAPLPSGCPAPSPLAVRASAEDGSSELFDAVLFTCPTPQVADAMRRSADAASSQASEASHTRAVLSGQYLRRGGDGKSAEDRLREVSYSSRLALAAFFDAPLKLPWVAKYFDHPRLRYVCNDPAKRGMESGEGAALIAHSSVPYGLRNIDREKNDVEPELTAALGEVMPGLPKPVKVHTHKWRYSQVYRPYSKEGVATDKRGFPTQEAGFEVLCWQPEDATTSQARTPLVVATGDAFSESTFEGCARAAERTVREVLAPAFFKGETPKL